MRAAAMVSILIMPGLGADRLTRLRAAHLEVKSTKAKIV